MKRITKNLLRAVLLPDAIMAIVFGLVSWFYPYETYGTIIAIPEMHAAAFLSILSSLSVFYIVIGLTCLTGIISTLPVTIWIGLLMTLRHLLEGIIKTGDVGESWLIGNLYPDLIIHTAFLIAYTVAIYFAYRSNYQAAKQGSIAILADEKAGNA